MSYRACLSASKWSARLPYILTGSRYVRYWSIANVEDVSRRSIQVHASVVMFTALAASVALALPQDTHSALGDKLKRFRLRLESCALVQRTDEEEARHSLPHDVTQVVSHAADTSKRVHAPMTIADETLIVCGSDRKGRPILIARPAMHKAASEAESLKAVRDCVQTVRKSLQLMPDGQESLLVLYDLFGASYKNFDMTFTRALLDDLNSEFADKLGQVLIVNGHWSMRAAWNTIRVLLHPETRQKVVFVGSALDQLENLIDPEHPYMERLRKSRNSQLAL